MKRFCPLLAALFALTIGFAIAVPSELKLKDGSIIKGEVAPVKPGEQTEVVVSTEYGIVRLPVEKLTDETKTKLGIGKAPTASDYEARILAMEARIKSLENENARLRRELAGTPAPSTSPTPQPVAGPRPTAPKTATPTSPTPPTAAASYSLSSTGKRHNARCRYYGSGKPCGAADGVACKICGG